MEKRKIIFGDYDTAAHGWTLTGWSFPTPEHRTNYVEVPGRDGPLDLSTALTDGEPRYGSRSLTVTLESSEGTRLEREQIIADMVNQLDGRRVDFVLPDDAEHYGTGRLHVVKGYNDNAHASVTVTAVCDPWRQAAEETVELASLSGKNLFDNQTLRSIIRNYGDATPIDSGVRVSTVQAGTWRYDLLSIMPISMLSGKTITLSWSAAASAANTPRVALGYVDAAGDNRQQLGVSLDYTGALTMRVDPGYMRQCDYVAIWLYSNHTGTAADGDYMDYTNLMVEIGDSATDYEAYAVESPKAVTLANNQRRTVCPSVIVQGETVVKYGDGSYALSDGSHKLAALQLTTGEHAVTVEGTGAVAFSYREAVL